jgi:hypothetical protein
MKLRKLPFVAVLVLGAWAVGGASCPEDEQVRAIQAYTTACNTATATVETLAGYRSLGKLSPGQIALMRELQPVSMTLCAEGTPPTDVQSALIKVNGIVAQLAAIALASERN